MPLYAYVNILRLCMKCASSGILSDFPVSPHPKGVLLDFSSREYTWLIVMFLVSHDSDMTHIIILEVGFIRWINCGPN